MPDWYSADHTAPRGVFRPRALYAMVHSAKYGNAPMPHSIFFYGQHAIHARTRSATSAALRRTAASASRPPTRRYCSPWCKSRGRKSASSDRPSAISRAARGIPGRRSDLRPSAIRGRSKNGRAIRSHCEGIRAGLTHGLITGNPRRNRAQGCRVFFQFRISGHRRFGLAGAG